jgi:hypothetical protein
VSRQWWRRQRRRRAGRDWAAGGRNRPKPSSNLRALLVGFGWSTRVVTGAPRAWVCLRRGAVVSGSARLKAAQGGQAHFRAIVCTGSRDARAVAQALGALAHGGGEVSAAGAGAHGALGSLCATLQRGRHWGFHAHAAWSELPYSSRRWARASRALRRLFSHNDTLGKATAASHRAARLHSCS